MKFFPSRTRGRQASVEETTQTHDFRASRITRRNLITVLVAGWASFIFGYSTNVMTGTLALQSFNAKFLSNDRANSTISGIVGG